MILANDPRSGIRNRIRMNIEVGESNSCDRRTPPLGWDNKTRCDVFVYVFCSELFISDAMPLKKERINFVADIQCESAVGCRAWGWEGCSGNY